MGFRDIFQVPVLLREFIDRPSLRFRSFAWNFVAVNVFPAVSLAT